MMMMIKFLITIILMQADDDHQHSALQYNHSISRLDNPAFVFVC